jgi:hypothetical protein
MLRSELECRLAIFHNHHTVEKIEISERDPTSFHVTLTLKPNIPISERLILRFEEAIGGPPKSLVLLRSPANSTVLRFTVRRSANTGDETEAGRVEETASLSYAKAGWQERSTVRVNFSKTRGPETYLLLFADAFYKGLERAPKRSCQTRVRDNVLCVQRSTKQWQGDGCRLDQASGHGGQD